MKNSIFIFIFVIFNRGSHSRAPLGDRQDTLLCPEGLL